MFKKRWGNVLLSLLVSLAYSAPAECEASFPSYHIRSLNTSAFPGAINDNGEAVFSMPPEGTSNNPYLQPGRALLWNGSVIESLINLGSKRNDVSDLSNNGIAVGSATPLIDGTTKVILHGPGPQATVLNISPGYSTSAVAIDNSGKRIVGSTTFSPTELPRAFLHEIGVGTVDLGNLGMGASFALDISDSGSLIVGISQTGATTDEILVGAAVEEAFLYKDGVMIGLGTLGGAISVAMGVSDAGIIVGQASNSIFSGSTHAFIFDELRGMRQIPTSSTSSIARAVNNSGLVVGRYNTGEGNRVAFIYDTDDGTEDLFSLLANPNGWGNLTDAVAINDHGQILGRGVFQGELTAYIASPITIPEPSTLALAVCGLMALMSYRRCRG